MYTLGLADQALREAGALPDPVKPASTLADLPVIKAFVIRYPSSSAQSIQDFYDAHSEKKRIYDTFLEYAKNGDADAARRVASMDSSAFVQLDGVREALSTMSRVIQLVNKNPEMTPDDKRQIIDAVALHMIDIAKGGNEILQEAESAYR